MPQSAALHEKAKQESELRATFLGKHTGTFFGVAPTGRTVSASLMILYRVEGKKIVQSWMEMNASALMDQLTEQALPVSA